MMVSIITPTLNSAKYLRETLLSIKAQGVEYNIEHIVVDGGSLDETKAIVESEGISKFYTLEGSSMYEAIDFGFKKSSGDILCWVNS
ncbi:MAG: glycosyltransferase, partial [Ignavibacteria bacterium]|nr:glycosyltransferase [Ignavibacteria bacterium]